MLSRNSWGSKCEFIGKKPVQSVPRNRLVQIQDNAADLRPGSQVRLVEILWRRGQADAHEPGGLLAVGSVVFSLSVEELEQRFCLAVTGGSGRGPFAGPVQSFAATCARREQ